MNTPFKRQKHSALRGFTLIELLVVVSIIVVLAGLTVGLAGFVQRKQSEAKAKTHHELLMAKLEEYRLDAGAFPEKRDVNGLILYTMLYGDGVGPDLIAGTADDTRPDGEPDEGAKIYLPELNPNTNQMGLLEVRPGSSVPTKVIDPWGGAWRYRAVETDPGSSRGGRALGVWGAMSGPPTRSVLDVDRRHDVLAVPLLVGELDLLALLHLVHAHPLGDHQARAILQHDRAVGGIHALDRALDVRGPRRRRQQ
jgi:prepilin-type N-terminal cleavage/methylation domain-containing protein